MLTQEEIEGIKLMYLRNRRDYLKKNLAPPMMGVYDKYILYHIYPGDFLGAVLKNQLTESFSLADFGNQRKMLDHAQFMYIVIPQITRKQNVSDWLALYPLAPTEEMLSLLRNQESLGQLHGN